VRAVRALLIAGALVAVQRCATGLLSPSAMSLDEKVGQLFVYPATGRFMNEASPEYRALVHQVRDNHVGGILWYLSSDVYETTRLNRRLQSLAAHPLIVAADLEAGVGMRFLDTTNWPWPMAVGATGDPSLAERQGRIVAEEARAMGVNQVYAPVADVNLDPANPTINVRSYGEDPSTVANFVSAFVRGVQSGAVLATVKHFPGHGDTRTDSHRSLPVLAVDFERLDRVELVPFRAAIRAGVGAVMTAHLSIPAVDATPAPLRTPGPGEDLSEVARDATVPASMSAAVVSGLLRDRLGFHGLVVSDALDMGGIVDHFEPGEAAVRAILAGADQVIKSADTDAAIRGVRRAVTEGRIPIERLDRSVEAVLAAKRRYPAAIPDPEAAFRIVDGPEHRALAEDIARRAVTLVRESAGALPLVRATKVVHVFVNDVVAGTPPGTELGRALASRLAAAPKVFVLDPRSRPDDVDPIVDAAAQGDVVLVSLFVRVRTGSGKLVLPDAARAAVVRLSATPAKMVGISFGNPYLVADLPGLSTYLAAYGDQPLLQTAVARALFGETAISGRLPVTIPGVAERGTGIQRASSAAATP
jgi:beta-N-acetylhexosaminidase